MGRWCQNVCRLLYVTALLEGRRRDQFSKLYPDTHLFKKKSLFISGCARSSLRGTAFSSCGSGGSCPVVQLLLASVVVEHGLQARGLQ